jgi:hypothetical protein
MFVIEQSCHLQFFILCQVKHVDGQRFDAFANAAVIRTVTNGPAVSLSCPFPTKDPYVFSSPPGRCTSAARYQGKPLCLQGRHRRHNGRARVRLRHGRDLRRAAVHERAAIAGRPRLDPADRRHRHLRTRVRRCGWFADGGHAVRQIRSPHDADLAVAGVHDRRTRHDPRAIGRSHGRDALRARPGRGWRVIHRARVHCRNGGPQQARQTGHAERADDRDRPVDRLRAQCGAGALFEFAGCLALHAGHCRRARFTAGCGHDVRAAVAALAGQQEPDGRSTPT